MTDTTKNVRKYAKYVSKKLGQDDFTHWVDFTHEDGTEMFIRECLFESVLETPSDPSSKKWVVIWTKNHGVFLYPNDELLEWEFGEQTELSDRESDIILPS